MSLSFRTRSKRVLSHAKWHQAEPISMRSPDLSPALAACPGQDVPRHDCAASRRRKQRTSDQGILRPCHSRNGRHTTTTQPLRSVLDIPYPLQRQQAVFSLTPRAPENHCGDEPETPPQGEHTAYWNTPAPPQWRHPFRARAKRFPAYRSKEKWSRNLKRCRQGQPEAPKWRAKRIQRLSF